MARLEAGMSVLHATLYAARRRVIPILITTLTTIAGLFSLATGLAGHSLVWGPVATAIVWGIGVFHGIDVVDGTVVVSLVYGAQSPPGCRQKHEPSLKPNVHRLIAEQSIQVMQEGVLTFHLPYTSDDIIDLFINLQLVLG